MANLTPKQQRFVEEYLIDLNATQAAIRAGYSEKTADSIGLQLLRKTQVAEAIAGAQEVRSRTIERKRIRKILMSGGRKGKLATKAWSMDRYDHAEEMGYRFHRFELADINMGRATAWLRHLKASHGTDQTIPTDGAD